MKMQLKHSLLLILSLLISFILSGCLGTPSLPTHTTRPVTSPATSAPVISPTFTATLTPSITASVANGQRIYDTATSDSGQPITHTGGPGMMMPVELTCEECHGPQGHGGTVRFMMQTFEVPNITWPELTAPGMMDHPPYTEATLKQAITQGIDPGGNPLEYPMPRWQMSAQDLNDLVAFIKTLK